MFTGIVEELGEVVAVERHAASARLSVRGRLVTVDVERGASISVNGVCLTVVEQDECGFTADVMLETLRRSTLGSLRPGVAVNLERAMAADGRFGGHVVQGHVDGTGRVVSRKPGDRWEVVTVSLPPDLTGYVVLKGSITVDGVSLTVSALDDVAGTFSVCLVPATLERTTLGQREPGQQVNIEVDVLAKYVERLLLARGLGGSSGATS